MRFVCDNFCEFGFIRFFINRNFDWKVCRFLRVIWLIAVRESVRELYQEVYCNPSAIVCFYPLGLNLLHFFARNVRLPTPKGNELVLSFIGPVGASGLEVDSRWELELWLGSEITARARRLHPQRSCGPPIVLGTPRRRGPLVGESEASGTFLEFAEILSCVYDIFYGWSGILRNAWMCLMCIRKQCSVRILCFSFNVSRLWLSEHRTGTC